MLWKVDCLHCRQMVGGEKKRKEGKERKGGATQRESVRRGQKKRRGWIWGQLCRLFWLLFGQERWVKMKSQKYSRSDFKIKTLPRSYLPVIWSWQWWLCELNELAAISWEGEKRRVCLLRMCLAVFTSAAIDQWACNLELFKPFKHITDLP